MLAAPVRVEADLEPHIRALVPGDHGSRCVAEQFRRRTLCGVVCVGIRLELDALEAVRGV
jgi:hypothetical protein